MKARAAQILFMGHIEMIKDFLFRLLVIVVILGVGALSSWIFYHVKRKELFGGFIGGMVIGVLGALIGAFILDRFLLEPVKRVLQFLVYDMDVNVVAAFIGAFFAVFIMNKLNHDKDRKKY
ncbi:MAG TPA: hypothetical protein PL161_08470 [Spirochaetota bacterium]|nr:hypothetical protein [Spirochaetota bacterium]